VYHPPVSLPEILVTIRNGLDGAVVEDGHVGGYTTCGAGLDHWTDWGEANYAGDELFNIQNQWDISDYPCFSKFFITFPLDGLPAGKEIISARLTLTLLGGSWPPDGSSPPNSYVQVLTVAEEWSESSLTWNNAPMALENISGTWVYPHDHDLPPQRYHFDVSRAVHAAYTSGEPLRLAIYSADGEMHSGKYFWTSDFGNPSMQARPTLQITLGTSCDAPGVECEFVYVPMVLK
jgi:hypothetical protein